MGRKEKSTGELQGFYCSYDIYLNTQMARMMASVRNLINRAGDPLEEPPDPPTCDESFYDDGGPLEDKSDLDP